MKLLDLTLPSPEENLAWDEALLEDAEDGPGGEILRLWESASPFVVLGYSNKINLETRRELCHQDRIPILRRTSGGGAVLQGPGCLNYSLILKIPDHGPLANLLETNQWVLEKHRQALEPYLGADLKVRGISDLVLGEMKFSGNAQRRKRAFFLFHGTFLYQFDLSMIGKYLAFPSRQPEYRKNRPHSDFVCNIPLPPDLIKKSLRDIWNTEESSFQLPSGKIKTLIDEKYSRAAWNEKF